MTKSLEIWAMDGSSWLQMESMLGVRSKREVSQLLATHGFKRHGNRSGFSVGPCVRCNESQSPRSLPSPVHSAHPSFGPSCLDVQAVALSPLVASFLSWFGVVFLTPTLPEVGGRFKFQLNLGHPQELKWKTKNS